MKYSRVYIDALGYELPSLVVTSAELEERLRPVFEKLRIPSGQLEALTGIGERRWWEPGYPLAEGAIAAARKALAGSGVRGSDLEVVIYGGISKDLFEPAAACEVAAALGVRDDAAVYDVTNACLGVLNGMVDVANRIELGQIRAGLVVSAESARKVVEAAIKQLLEEPTMENVRTSLATLTGGAGAAAVLLTDGSFGMARRRLVGGVTQTAPQFHDLCRAGLTGAVNSALRYFTNTDSAGLLKHGVALCVKTWQAFMQQLGWTTIEVNRVICHQVGALHRDTFLGKLGIPLERDFSTFPFLGNMATVSLPLSAALAEERDFLRPGDRVGLVGVASGLNCMLLGVEWQQLETAAVTVAPCPDYPFASHFLDLNGLRYHYLDEGAGEPVLMLHGNPTWSFYYRRLALALRDHWRVIVPDHIGCGLSDKPADVRYRYTLEQRARDVEALLDHLDIEKNLTLVLHDWGGMIGMVCAHWRPERIKRLVLLNTAAFHLPAGKTFPWSLWLCRNTPLGPWLVRGLNLFCRAASRVCSKHGLSAAVRRGYLAPYDSWANRIAVLRFVQDIPLTPADPAYALVSAVQAGLPHFRDVPTLICWGAQDFVFDDHFLHAWKEYLPQAEVHRFADAGHFVLEDAADRIIPLMRDFLVRTGGN